MKKNRIMSPPRRPKGEKPATTIRFLKRQINNIQTELDICRQAMRDRDKTIAQQAVFLDENEERERILTRELEAGAEAHGELLAQTHTQRLRLAFLEGYYAKAAETFTGAGPGYPGPYSYSPERSETGRPEDATERDGGTIGRTLRGIPPNDPAYYHRRPMAEDPVAGPAHDATELELARHRR